MNPLIILLNAEGLSGFGEGGGEGGGESLSAAAGGGLRGGYPLTGKVRDMSSVV